MLKRAVVIFILAGTACTPSSPTDSDSTPAVPAVTINSYSLNACTSSASPLPGWRNCQGTVTLTVNKAVTSGYVSVFFSYPDSGTFYHGDLQVGSGVPGRVVINVVNNYVSHCVTSYATTFEVYDGPQSAGSAPLLLSHPQTLSITCT